MNVDAPPTYKSVIEASPILATSIFVTLKSAVPINVDAPPTYRLVRDVMPAT